MIVDILDRHDCRQFGLTGLFTRVAEPLTKRSGAREQTVYTEAVVTPPSTTMVWPVMKLDAPEAR